MLDQNSLLNPCTILHGDKDGIFLRALQDVYFIAVLLGRIGEFEEGKEDWPQLVNPLSTIIAEKWPEDTVNHV